MENNSIPFQVKLGKLKDSFPITLKKKKVMTLQSIEKKKKKKLYAHKIFHWNKRGII